MPLFANDLAFAVERGAVVTVTKNGVDVTGSVSPSIASVFRGSSDRVSRLSVANTDTVVLEVDFTNYTQVSELASDMTWGINQTASNVTIELFHSGTWNTIFTSTNSTAGIAWKRIATPHVTKARYTMTNCGTLLSFYSVWAQRTGNSTYGSSLYLTRNGGNVYGTAAVPSTFTAYGSDANIGINLVPKGTGLVEINGIEAVDVSKPQTLSNKTLASVVLTGTATLNGNPVVSKVAVPASKTAAGVAGQTAADATHIYYCHTDNQWVRAAIDSTW